MVKMTKEVMDLVRWNRPALVITVSGDGTPNAAPKGSLTVLDQEHLVYADLVEGRTSRNVEENPKLAVVVMGPEGEGYQIKGRGRKETTGMVYQQMCEAVSVLRIPLPPPQAVVIIEVEEVDRIDPVRPRSAKK